MKITELFRTLSFGELSNLAISGDGSGTIIEAKHPQIIQYINEGLLRLFSRFTLREKDVLVEQVRHITNYHLKSLYAESRAAETGERWPYVKDLHCEPFQDDVIRILEVHDSFGRALPLNDKDRADSLFTPQPDVLQVPSPCHGSALGILYQARHEILQDQGEDYLEQEIELPFFLHGALTAFIGHKVYSHMNGPENLAKSQEYAAAYEGICLEVEQKDLVNQSWHTSHHKLEQRGFV